MDPTLNVSFLRLIKYSLLIDLRIELNLIFVKYQMWCVGISVYFTYFRQCIAELLSVMLIIGDSTNPLAIVIYMVRCNNAP